MQHRHGDEGLGGVEALGGVQRGSGAAHVVGEAAQEGLVSGAQHAAVAGRRVARRDEHDLGRRAVPVHLGREQRNALLQSDSGDFGLCPEVVGEGAQQRVSGEALNAAAQRPVQQHSQCGWMQLLESGLHSGHLNQGADVHQSIGDGVHLGPADVGEVGLLGSDVGCFDGVVVDEDDLAHPAPREVLGVSRRPARSHDHHTGAGEKGQVVGISHSGEHLRVRGGFRRARAEQPKPGAMDCGEARSPARRGEASQGEGTVHGRLRDGQVEAIECGQRCEEVPRVSAVTGGGPCRACWVRVDESQQRDTRGVPVRLEQVVEPFCVRCVDRGTALGSGVQDEAVDDTCAAVPTQRPALLSGKGANGGRDGREDARGHPQVARNAAASSKAMDPPLPAMRRRVPLPPSRRRRRPHTALTIVAVGHSRLLLWYRDGAGLRQLEPRRGSALPGLTSQKSIDR